MMDTDKTILSSTGKTLAIGMDGDGVDGTEMTTDTTALLQEDLVVETAFEFTLPCAGGGDIHGLLTTPKDDKILDGSNGGGIQGGISGVDLEGMKGRGLVDDGGLILGRGDKVGTVSGELDVGDDGIMLLGGGHLLPGLPVVEGDGTIFVTCDNVLVEVGPTGHGGLGALGGDLTSELGGLGVGDIGVLINAHNNDGTGVTHPSLGDHKDILIILGPLDALYGCFELPGVKELAGPNIP